MMGLFEKSTALRKYYPFLTQPWNPATQGDDKYVGSA